MKKQVRAIGRIEIVCEIWMGAQDQGGLFAPPQIPVVLPAVKPVARDAVGQVEDGRPSHEYCQEAVGDED